MKRFLMIAAGSLCATLLLTGCGASNTGTAIIWPDPAIEGNLSDNLSPGTDLAAYSNYDWYNDTQIPEGYSRWTVFSQLDQEVKKAMIATLQAPDSSTDQQKAAQLFAVAGNMEARDAAGLGILKESFEAILGVQSLSELSQLLTADPMLSYFEPLINTGVWADRKNSSINVAYISAPSLSLEDAAEYTQRTERGERLQKANDTYYQALLTHNGVAAAEADSMIAAALEWETKLAAGIYPVETTYRADYDELTYNVYSAEELAGLAPDFPLAAILNNVGLGSAQRFVVKEPEALKTLNTLFTEENLSGIKAWLAMGLLNEVAVYGDAFTEDAYIDRTNAIFGSTGRKADEVRYFTLCDNLCSELLGRIYADKYFDEACLDDIADMVQKINSIYKERLMSADWLTEETRRTAVAKLDSMTLRIGFPQVYKYDWDQINVTADKALLDNAVAIIIAMNQQDNIQADQPVNNDIWELGAHVVNAYYSPADNSINFPAAILQQPFYDAAGSSSANLGGIGAVIAHEITHAFDTNGSQYDKDGNMVNWWTEKDRAAFKSRTDKVAAYYANIEVVNGLHVNGDLTIGETVADLGAMACTLDIMKTMDSPDYRAFFAAWTDVWVERITSEQREHQLKTDPHAPNYLRANVTSQQYQEFYDSFGVKEGDFMYLSPEKRLQVW